MKRLNRWGITLIVLLIGLSVNIPLLSTLLTSLKKDADISAFPPKFIFTPTLDHFKNVLYAAGYDFPKFFLTSILLATGTSILVILITLPAAYSILRMNFGSGKLFGFAVGLRLFPPIIFAIPYYLMFHFLGMLDTVMALILINTFLNVPLGLLLMMGFLREIPLEIEESAKIDGCSPYQILAQIVTPVMAPGIAAVAILTFIFSWNDYLFAVIISLNKSIPVTLGSTYFITSWGIKWGDISAATLLSVLPPLLFTFLAQRYLVSGLSMGAVKG